MGYKGSFLADEIMLEYREEQRWKRYAERIKQLKEENKCLLEKLKEAGSTEEQEKSINKEAKQ